jgi:hypothetical protein
MAAPNSRETLANYCLRQLGAPVLEINLDDDQISDRIDEAIQYYQTFHGDGTMKSYAKHTVTPTDITNRYITLPDEWIFVTRVLPFISNGNTAVGMWSAKYRMLLEDIYDIHHHGEILSYVMTMEYLNTLDIVMNGAPLSRWTRHMNRINIDAAWGQEIVAGDYIVVEGHTAINPATFVKVYNDLWLKRYLTALLKRNWGQNLIKFEGIMMPGGVTLNGRQIYDDGVAEVEKLEADMESKFQLPVDFQVG